MPYLGMPGVVLPPVQCGQVGTQPCAQMVEEDHIEWDAHQGIEDTEDLPCLRAGCQVSITYRAKECADPGKREPRPGSHPPTTSSSRGLSPSPLWEDESSLFPWTLTLFSERRVSTYRKLISSDGALLTATLCLSDRHDSLRCFMLLLSNYPLCLV